VRGGTAPTLFLTSALEGGEWSASSPGPALPPGKGPPVPFVWEFGWALEPIWTQMLDEKFSSVVGNRTPLVQSAGRLNHCKPTLESDGWSLRNSQACRSFLHGHSSEGSAAYCSINTVRFAHSYDVLSTEHCSVVVFCPALQKRNSSRQSYCTNVKIRRIKLFREVV
jgi:hypothetical protein